MFYINDDFFDASYLIAQRRQFEALELNAYSRIAVCLEDTALWLALCFYLQEIDASVMPIHPAMPKETAIKMATKAGCETLFYHQLEHPLPLDRTSDTKAHNSECASGVLIQMSSGTTGEPKCIDRTWQSIDREIESYLSVFTLPNDMSPLIACPVTHSYGLICGVLVALARGKTPKVVTNINPKYLIKSIVAADKPLLYTSPTMLQGVLRLLPQEQKLHAVMSSGTLLPKQTFEQFAPRINHFFQQYGCSEAGCIAINQNMTSAIEVGTPLPHLTLIAGDGCEQPAEIVVTTESGQQIHTNDLGFLSQSNDGQPVLSFIARLDDTIIVAGLNVYPQEVEDLILEHPDVEDAVIFKVEDPYAGQRVGLQYTLIETSELTMADLRHWCQQHLATFQIPQHFDQVNAIERLANGKVNRKRIAQVYQNKLQAEREARQAARAEAIH